MYSKIRGHMKFLFVFFVFFGISYSAQAQQCNGVAGAFRTNPDGSASGFVASTAIVAPTVIMSNFIAGM